jgi:hypothetical protein
MFFNENIKVGSLKHLKFFVDDFSKWTKINVQNQNSENEICKNIDDFLICYHYAANPNIFIENVLA